MEVEPIPRPAMARPAMIMFMFPLAAVMMVPPTMKTQAATRMVYLRPNFSANGKVARAPKKQPAWKVETMLPWMVSRSFWGMSSMEKSFLKESRAMVPPMTAVS